MITTTQILNATSTTSLDELVEQAAFERDCELYGCTNYQEAAEFFAQEAPKSGNGRKGMEELTEILEAASTKRHELEA